MIILEELLERFGNREAADPVVERETADDGATELLEGEGKVANEGQGQHRLEEHAARRVLVVLDKAADAGRREDARVVRIETEAVLPLFDSRVQRSTVATEADGEEELLLGAVPQEEASLRSIIEQTLSLVAIHHAPVVAAVGDLFEVRYDVVYVVDLRVYHARHQRQSAAVRARVVLAGVTVTAVEEEVVVVAVLHRRIGRHDEMIGKRQRKASSRRRGVPAAVAGKRIAQREGIVVAAASAAVGIR